MEKKELIWLQSSYLPKNKVSYNEWSSALNVSSKIPLHSGNGLKHSLNDEYDFSKLFKKKTRSFSFSSLFKYLKFGI